MKFSIILALAATALALPNDWNDWNNKKETITVYVTKYNEKTIEKPVTKTEYKTETKTEKKVEYTTVYKEPAKEYITITKVEYQTKECQKNQWGNWS